MFFLQRILPILSSASTLLLLAFLVFQRQAPTYEAQTLSPSFIYLSVGISFVIPLLSLLFIGTGKKILSRLAFSPYLITSWLGSIAILMMTDVFWIQVTILGIFAFSQWLWLEHLYTFWQRHQFYQPYSIQRVGAYLYLYAIFSCFSGLSAAQTLLQLPLWGVIPVGVLVFFWLQYDFYRLNSVKTPKALFQAVIASFLCFQLILVLHLLPSHFFLYGVIIMMFFYIFSQEIRNSGKAKKKSVKDFSTLAITVVGVLIVFFTSLWTK